MFLGHALGDALGAPHEFPPYGEYTGELTSRIVKKSQWQPTKYSAIGQVTDDTEMAMSLLYSMEDGFSEERTIQEYMKWASNDGYPGQVAFLGKATRNLFAGVKTLKGYEGRYKKEFSKRSKEDAQSNGALMRAYPLVFVPKSVISKDVSLSNPSSVTIELIEIYISAVDMALRGATKDAIIMSSDKMITKPSIRESFDQAVRGEFRDITKNRGWALHGFYCAFWGLIHFNDYASAVNAIICLSPVEGQSAPMCKVGDGPFYHKNKDSIGDTDTNAAIAGALIGAYYGLSEMCHDPVTKYNLSVLLTADPNDTSYSENVIGRPDRYHTTLNNVNNLVNIASKLYKKTHGSSLPSASPEVRNLLDELGEK
jgi:ADP-ribosylglycohydrolase